MKTSLSNVKKAVLAKGIFVSYAHEDKKQVIAMCRILESLGHRVFRDEDVFKVGDTLPDKIRTRIKKSCIFLLCSSKYVAKSKWVDQELEVARKRHDKKQLTIIPLLFDDSQYLPELISDILGTDVASDKTDVERFSRVLSELISAKSHWWCRFKKWFFLIGICTMLYVAFFTYSVLRCKLLSAPMDKLCELSIRSQNDWPEDSKFKIAILPSPKLDVNTVAGQIEFGLISRISSHIAKEELDGNIAVRYCPIEELSDMQKVQMAETALKVGADLTLRLVYDEAGESRLEYNLKDTRSKELTTVMKDVLLLPDISVRQLSSGNTEVLQAIDGSLRYCMGIYSYYERDFQSAVKHFRYCEEVDYLFNGFVYTNIGHAYMFLGQDHKSKEYFRKAVEFDKAGNTHLYHLYSAFEYVRLFEKNQLDSINESHCLLRKILSNEDLDQLSSALIEQIRVVNAWDSTFFKKSNEIIECKMTQPRSSRVFASVAFVSQKVYQRYKELNRYKESDSMLRLSIDFLKKSLDHVPVIDVRKQNLAKGSSAYNLWEILFNEFNEFDTSYKYLEMAFDYYERHNTSNTYLLQEGGACFYRKASDTTLGIGRTIRRALADSAEKFLATVLGLDTTDYYAYHYLGLLYKDLKPDAVRAEYNLAKAVNFYPEDLTNQLDYGQVLWLNRKWDKALQTFKKAFQLNPDHYGTCDCLAKVYEKMGNRQRSAHFKSLAEDIKGNARECEVYFDLELICKE